MIKDIVSQYIIYPASSLLVWRWINYLCCCLLCHLWFSCFDCATFQFPVPEKEKNKQSFSTGFLSSLLHANERKMLIDNMFPYQPQSTFWSWEHCSFDRKDSAVLGVLQQTHIDAMEVDTPVGSSPGGNKAITMLARGGQGGACGCQSSHRSYSFLYKRGEERAFSDWKTNTHRPWTVIWQLDNKTGR